MADEYPVEELDGMWWVPSAGQDKAVAGTLAINENGTSQLKLIGMLRKLALFEYSNDGEEVKPETTSNIYPRIFGDVAGNAVTLDDCFTVHRSTHFGQTVGSERIRVNRIVRGAHFDEEEPISCSSASVGIKYLTEFIAETGISEQFGIERDAEGTSKFHSHTVEMKVPEDIAFAGSDGEVCSLTYAYDIEGSGTNALRLSQQFKLRVETFDSSPVSQEQFSKIASGVQDLVSIATGRSAEFLSWTLRHPDVAMNGKSDLLPLELNANWLVRDRSTRKFERRNQVFNLEDFGGVDVLTHWLKVAGKNRSGLGRVMSLRYAKDSFAEDLFMGCAAAIEGYDRDRNSDKASYRDRVKRTGEHAGYEFKLLVEDLERWATCVKTNRNTVAHHNDGIAEASAAQATLARTCFWAYLLCLFKDAGAAQKAVDKISQTQSWGRLRQDVSFVLSQSS